MSRRNVQMLLDAIEDEATQNYHNFDSALSYDDDASVMNFDSALSYDAEDSVMSFSGEQKAKGPSTYAVNILYTDNSGSGNPVEVELFGTDFNTGVQVGASLVFTNQNTDTATVTGRTANFIAFQNRLRYANFRIKFARLNPVDAAQFSEQIRYQMDSVYGGGKFNTQLPEEYFTPEQFQSLRVDVPMGYRVDSERRIITDVGATEVAPGYNITFWIDALENSVRKLQGKPSVINMGGQGIQQSSPSISTREALNKLITLEKVKAKVSPRFRLR